MENKMNMQKMDRGMYEKLMISLLISFVIMYIVMFLNVSEGNHIYLSLSRTYMALLMVSPMAIVMLLVMGKMYPDKKRNTIIIITSLIIFIVSLAALRTQTPVGDVQYMKAMIPHHSSAIMTSENARLQDPEVKKLAEEIIKAQEEEISKMESIIERLQ
ncbi:DUF305 domain-containing protein [Flavihumibacter sediminis]|nr:DUF305 domain-containing protein [Flavihumibacter sediminis]